MRVIAYVASPELWLKVTECSCGFQAQQTLSTCLNETMVQVDELKAQLKEERLKSLELEKRLQSANITTTQREEVRAHTCWPFQVTASIMIKVV